MMENELRNQRPLLQRAKWAFLLLLIAGIAGLVWQLEQQRSDKLLAETMKLGESGDGRIISATVHQPEVTAAHWSYLQRLPDLRSLVLSETASSEVGLAELRLLPELRELSLRNCAWVADDDLQELARLSQLNALNLSGTAVSAAGLKHLAGLPALRYLSLDGCRNVTDDAHDVLIALTSLEEVHLSQTGTTLDGFESLRKSRRDLVILISPDHLVPGIELDSQSEDVSSVTLRARPAPADASLLIRLVSLPHNWQTGASSEPWRTNITALRLRGPSAGTLLSKLASEFPAMTGLYVYETTIPRDIGPWPETVTSFRVSELSPESDLSGLSGLVSLETLLLFHDVSRPVGGYTFLKSLPGLTSLDISGAELQPEDFAVLATLRPVEFLGLCGRYSPVTDELIAPLLADPNLPNLKTLSIYAGELSPEKEAQLRKTFPQASIRIGRREL